MAVISFHTEVGELEFQLYTTHYLLTAYSPHMVNLDSLVSRGHFIILDTIETPFHLFLTHDSTPLTG